MQKHVLFLCLMIFPFKVTGHINKMSPTLIRTTYGFNIRVLPGVTWAHKCAVRDIQINRS